VTTVLIIIVIVGLAGLIFAYFKFGARGQIDKHPADRQTQSPGAAEDPGLSNKDEGEIPGFSERGNE